MPNDYDDLAALNVDIATAETEGDAAFFEKLLAPQFAMRRANGAIIGRADFVAAVTKSQRRATAVESITFLGNRALVQCIVSMGPTGDRNDFNNLRLFVREAPDHAWMLLAWANEPARRPA
jgi:hypothetical protein